MIISDDIKKICKRFDMIISDDIKKDMKISDDIMTADYIKWTYEIWY